MIRSNPCHVPVTAVIADHVKKPIAVKFEACTMRIVHSWRHAKYLPDTVCGQVARKLE